MRLLDWILGTLFPLPKSYVKRRSDYYAGQEQKYRITAPADQRKQWHPVVVQRKAK